MVWKNADTKYFKKSEEIQDYYHVYGVPHIRLNGEIINYLYFTPTFYEDYIGLTTPIKLNVVAEMQGDSLTTTIKVFSDEAIDEPMVLRILPMEKEAFDVAIRYDNDDPYHNVVYDLVNGLEGIPVTSIGAGEELEFSITNSITEYKYEEGTLEDMAVLVYIQNIASKEVYQSKQIDVKHNFVQPQIYYSIENGAIDVDTANLLFNISSNRMFFAGYGDTIAFIDKYVELHKNDVGGEEISATIKLGINEDSIYIKPNDGWEENTQYFIVTKDLTTLEGIKMPIETVSFTTANYTGIANKTTKQFEFYPNPATNFIVVNMDNKGVVEILNLSGQVVKTVNLHKGTNSLDISEICTGAYFFRIKLENRSEFGKIIIE